MNQNYIMLGLNLKVLIRTPYAMRRVTAVIKKPRLGEIRYRRFTVTRYALFVLTTRLRNMNVQRTLEITIGLR